MTCIIHISILSDTRQSLNLGFHSLGWKQVSKYQIFNKKEQLFEVSPYQPNYVLTFCTIQSLKETPQLFLYLFQGKISFYLFQGKSQFFTEADISTAKPNLHS